MNFGDIKRLDVANSPKVGSTLFVSGCTHDCEGCFNKEAQSFSYGKLWTPETEDYFIDCLNHPQVKHANILGGEPMQQHSGIMLHLVKRIKAETNTKIWMWTGCLYEDLLQKEDKLAILKYVDVLIDGKFELDKRDLMLKHRGSSNQRIIDIQKSFDLGRVVLYDKDTQLYMNPSFNIQNRI